MNFPLSLLVAPGHLAWELQHSLMPPIACQLAQKLVKMPQSGQTLQTPSVHSAWQQLRHWPKLGRQRLEACPPLVVRQIHQEVVVQELGGLEEEAA